MGSRKEKIGKFIQMEEEDDDEFFLSLFLPYLNA